MGDVVVLSGDLGAGKTTLTQGIAEGLGVTTRITSPTFVISKIYELPSGRLIHVDAYRLSSFGEVDELADEVFASDAITIIEWGEAILEALPDAYRVAIEHSGDGRRFLLDERFGVIA
jgi:tRNA threonylcarbamoyladenosine biosynthesis protein TsaE